MTLNTVRLETSGSLQEKFCEFFSDLKEEICEAIGEMAAGVDNKLEEYGGWVYKAFKATVKSVWYTIRPAALIRWLKIKRWSFYVWFGQQVQRLGNTIGTLGGKEK